MAKLALDFSDCQAIGDFGLESLFLALKQITPDLYQLTLNFSSCSQLSNQEIAKLSPILEFSCQNLKILSLNFENCREMVDETSIKIICDSLVRAKCQLTHLSLNLSLNPKINDQCFSELGRFFSVCCSDLKLLYLNIASHNNKNVSLVTDQGIIELAKGIKDSQMKLNQLLINFSNFHKLTEEGLNSLAIAFSKYSDSINSISINLKGCSAIESNMGTHISSILSTGKNQLQCLSLQLSNCSKLEDNDIKQIANTIQDGQIQVETLNLEFSNCSRLTATSMTYVNKIILLASKNTKSFSLDISKNQFLTEKCLSEFQYIFRNRAPSELRSLSFNLSPQVKYAKQITEQALLDFIFSLKDTKSLMKLELNFSDTVELNGKIVKQLSNQLLTFNPLLDSIDLNFANCKKINDKGMLALASTIQQKKFNLSHVSINLKEAEIGDSSLTEFLGSIGAHSKNLNHFEIILDQQYPGTQSISNKSLESISKVMKEQIQQLKKLAIGFDVCNPIDNQGVQQFSETLSQYHPTLDQLEVNFGNCNKIQDQGIEKIFDSLGKYNQLTTLNLNFNHNIFKTIEITNNSLHSLANVLQKQNLLIYNLSLDMSLCRNISTIGLKDIAQALESKADLMKNLSLNFNGCTSINDQGFTLIMKSIFKANKCMEKFGLDFSSCNLTDQGFSCFEQLKTRGQTQLGELKFLFKGIQKLTSQGIGSFSIFFMNNCQYLNKFITDFNNCPLIDNKGKNLLDKMNVQMNVV